jgi:hypothetical protein
MILQMQERCELAKIQLFDAYINIVSKNEIEKGLLIGSEFGMNYNFGARRALFASVRLGFFYAAYTNIQAIALLSENTSMNPDI